MKSRIGQVVLSGLLISGLFTGDAPAREVRPDPPRQDHADQFHAPIAGLNQINTINRSAAGTDTTFLGSWSFDTGGICDPQGWTSVDYTEQIGAMFHVDDFSGLNGGDFGWLVPLEGNQSLWCGLRPVPDDPELCGYAALPGYGNNWDQRFRTVDCVAVDVGLTIDFLIMWDSEPGYDATQIEADACDNNWTMFAGGLGTYDSAGKGFRSHRLPDSLFAPRIRLRFRFISDGAWSDQDGLWDTDGAVIIDSLTVRDTTGVLLPTELFEVEAVGDNDAASGNWESYIESGYGDFAALYPGGSLVQEDPCVSNLTCMCAFIKGSEYDYGCGGWPGQKAVPYENERGQYINNAIWSPWIPITGSGSQLELSYDVYGDLQMNALVGKVWEVRSMVDGCAGSWGGSNSTNSAFTWKDWFGYAYGIGQYLHPAATHIQVSLGVRDMCGYWCGVYGNGECHSHAPLYDNVQVYRVATDGPQVCASNSYMFQDNFSTDGTITGTARADMALDPWNSSAVVPGDSVVFSASDADHGLDFHVPGDTSSGPAAYCYVSVDGPNRSTPGTAFVDDPRYSVVGDVMASGRTWTQIQADSTWYSPSQLRDGYYNVDLNDNLFVPGDTVWFFFGARSAPPSNKWTWYAWNAPNSSYWRNGAETADIDLAASNADEFTILPAGGYQRGGDILYVDGGRYKSFQEQFDWAFDALGLTGLVDRFDMRDGYERGGHPGYLVKDPAQQVAAVYNRIVWSAGLYYSYSFDDGTSYGGADDAGLLATFMDSLTSPGGVYLCGNDVARVWSYFSSPSAEHLRQYMGYTVSGYSARLPLGVSPLVVGEAGSIFEAAGEPDSMVVFGGCPYVPEFNQINPAGSAALAASYNGAGNTAGAVLNQRTTNPNGVDVGFVLSGFDFSFIRDAHAEGVPARSIHMERILNWLGNPVGSPTGIAAAPRYTNSLGQNYPNPFNPTTTIEYSIAEPGHVTLREYNVAGQLVRTLVDEVQSPEQVRSVRWNGINDRGQSISSGVYFYKLTTKRFTKTRKMVVLK